MLEIKKHGNRYNQLFIVENLLRQSDVIIGILCQNAGCVNNETSLWLSCDTLELNKPLCTKLTI